MGRDQRFDGMIAGFGTTSGTRIVCGLWKSSPYGRFGDAMIETADGARTLVAPPATAGFIASTYSFDRVVETDVTWSLRDGRVTLQAAGLDIVLRLGAPTWIGRVLRLVPTRLATDPRWLAALDPIARTLAAGTRTAGTAGNGRREFYGALASRQILDARADWQDERLGALRPLTPPVRFGFGSAPARPQVVRIVSIVRLPS